MHTLQYFLSRRYVTPLIFISSILCAQSSLANEYQIELLIFEHLSPTTSDEIWEASLIDTPVSGTRNVNWVTSGDLKLNAEYKRLKSSRHYRPLLHTAWIENVAKKNSARPVRMPGNIELSSTGKKLNGTAKVHVGRYLHLELDLYLPAGNSIVISDFNLPESSGRYHLKESRRMRSKRAHYFDHPHMGVLAVITPIDQS